MSKQVLDLIQRCPRIHRQAGKGMTQVMNAQVLDSGSRKKSIKRLARVVQTLQGISEGWLICEEFRKSSGSWGMRGIDIEHK